MLRSWDELPEYMRTEAVRPYYNGLKKKSMSILAKKIFDVVVATISLIVMLPLFLIIAILIVKDSPGGAFFRQERVTQYGKIFKILKFRTMVTNANQLGSDVTVFNDNRITKIGKMIRKARLDEIPQLINIIRGDMSFVGTRPESVKYVKEYTPEMMATLLLPAGVTSETSIRYKDEDILLRAAKDADKAYITEVLPKKMKYNLDGIKNFTFLGDIIIMLRTVMAVIR